MNLDITKARSILVVNLIGLGDNIMSIPLVKKIREFALHARIDLLLPPDRAALFSGIKLSNIFQIDPQNAKSLDKLNLPFYDLVFDCNTSSADGNPDYQNILRKLNFSKCIGFDNDDLYSHLKNHIRIKKIKPFLFFGLKIPKKVQNIYFQYLRLLTPFGYTPLFSDTAVNIPVDKKQAAKASKIFVKNKFNICICPGSPAKQKRWQSEKYTLLVDYLYSKYSVNIILMGAYWDNDAANSILKQSKCKILNLVGKTRTADFIAILSNCDLVICNEGGTMHTAAALNKKAVILTDKKKIMKFFPPRAATLTPVYAENIKNIRLSQLIPACDIILRKINSS
jgi:ADP-heptose:LPS heptosyltransferase